MTKQEVIAFRDNAKKEGKQIFLYLDNSLTFYDNLRDCEAMIWDDENEECTVIGSIRVTDSVYLKAKTPYEMYTFTYEMIQGMGVYLSFDNMVKELETFVQRGLISQEDKADYINKLAPLSRTNTAPLSRTMRTYTPEDYAKYQEEQREKKKK